MSFIKESGDFGVVNGLITRFKFAWRKQIIGNNNFPEI